MADVHPLLLERITSVAVLTFNRPEKLNAITSEMIGSLLDSLDELAKDRAIRAVVLTGAGRAFSAGADLGAAVDPDLLRNRGQGPLGSWVEPLARFPKPTLAMVNGVAAGGGLAAALACDIRLAGASARFTTSFVKTARPAMDGVSYFLPRLVGIAQATRLLYSAEIVDASEAARIGLVERVVADDLLRQESMDLAQRLAAGPPVALRILKAEIAASLDHSLVDQLRMEDLGLVENQRRAGADIEEGYRAFFEKRSPRFQGD